MTGRAISRGIHLLGIATALSTRAMSAQGTGPMPARALFVNDEWERYARAAQLAGVAPMYPWSIRAFGPWEWRTLLPTVTAAAHPWSNRGAYPVRRVGAVLFTTLAPEMQTTFNSAFPYGFNDGPVWSGRGLTTAIQGGFEAVAGPLSLVVKPIAFRSENAGFALRANGDTGTLAFGDAFIPDAIDQPQRFGAAPYQRLDPGNSTIRIDWKGAAIGFSTANQQWGPAVDQPLLLGNNAAGFPQVFAATSHPVNARILQLHGRVFWGRLDSSPYTFMRTANRYRYATGLVVEALPSFAPGLEIGAARFLHILWSDSVLSRANLTRAFGGLLGGIGSSPAANDPANQLASVFARWAFPRSGFEVYGEFAREDYALNVRNFETEPDHDAGYLVGVMKTYARASRVWWVGRAEVLNTRISLLQTSVNQGEFYTHTPVNQGHTQLGQVLGSIGAFGGGAAELAVDRYSPDGRMTFMWSRIMRKENRDATTGVPKPLYADVMHAFTVSGLAYRGPVALNYELTQVYEFNRNFGGNASNTRVGVGLRYDW